MLEGIVPLKEKQYSCLCFLAAEAVPCIFLTACRGLSKVSIEGKSVLRIFVAKCDNKEWCNSASCAKKLKNETCNHS